MDIVNKILDTISSGAKQEKRNYIGASLIGKECPRAIWYAYHNYPAPISPEMQITFDIGKRLESLVLDYLEKAGFIVLRPDSCNSLLHCADSEAQNFQGHMDAVMTHEGMPVVVEIKTAKNSQFQAFKEKGLQTWSGQYYAQIQSYMGMCGMHKGVLIAINKDTSALHAEWVDFDELLYHELRVKALAVTAIDEPPERINKSPLYYVCRKCQFKEVCFGAQC